MAKYKMAATEMAKGRITSNECYIFLEFYIRPVPQHNIYTASPSEVRPHGGKQSAEVSWEVKVSWFIFSLP